MKRDKVAYWLMVLGYALIIAFFVWLVAGMAHATTTSSQKNVTGFIPPSDNPYTYKAGMFLDAAVVGSQNNRGMTLRIQPLGMPALFTETILFCDAEHAVDKFQGKGNPGLLTYRTRDSRMIEGIGCHDLIRVDGLQ